jgi:hypothetical protein
VVGRGFAGLDGKAFASAAGVSLSRLSALPMCSRAGIAPPNNLEAIMRVLLEAGIELFRNDTGKATGVAIRKKG